MRLPRIIPVILLIGVAIGAWFWLRPQSPDLPHGISLQQFRRAETRLTASLRRSPEPAEVWMRLGMDAATSEVLLDDVQLLAAAACFRRIADSHVLAPSARLQEGHLWLKHQVAAEAEQSYRDVLAIAESADVEPAISATARSFLIYILSVEIRLEERSLILRDAGDRARPWTSGDPLALSLNECKQLYFPHMLGLNSEKGRRQLGKFLETDPDNPNLLAAQGRYLTLNGQLDQARHYLEAVIKKHPIPECRAALLDCCYQQDDWSRIEELLPNTVAEQELWLVTRLRGQRALRNKEWKEAEAFFRQLLSEESSDQESHIGLAAALKGQQRDRDRQDVLRASAVLARIRVEMVRVRDNTPEEAKALAGLCRLAGLSEAASDFGWHARRMADQAEGQQ